jgi:hypothetical protein
MDAATLYIVLTLPDGGQRASIVGVPTWATCRQHVAFLQELKRMDPDAPIVRYRCMFKMPHSHVSLDICNSHHRHCEFYRTSTHRGCETLRWIIYMRDRTKMGSCRQDPPPEEEHPQRRSE